MFEIDANTFTWDLFEIFGFWIFSQSHFQESFNAEWMGKDMHGEQWSN